ncbi:hypothetical protein DVR12_17325 [Chitinophaga silvatica]|uniref:Lipoprotein n=1 Tax=Chitinophaga silvatica TaxID=2282649 RepID=A0A3E1Y7Q5_9BACT|nr:hypothetical protein [Chitinophaga silvatica]RFS21099.1 hypothetical protein DVR12_17325 [Chitinophaga silvatica]
MSKKHLQPLLTVFIAISLIITSCSKDHDDHVTPTPVVDLYQRYLAAIDDAMVSDSSEIIDTLQPIISSNQLLKWKIINGQTYVLMATFMKYPSSYPEGDSITNTWGESWLFIPEQMKRRIMSDLHSDTDTINRISEMLGLPPHYSKSNTHIAEMWVKAVRLYRPAGNPDITTTTTGAPLIVNAPQDYSSWFNNYIIYAYYRYLSTSFDYHYPWTRLGYTYDWAPGKKKVGLSEYVLMPSSGCWVEKVRTADDYFKQ